MNTTVIFSMYAHAVKRALALLKSLPDTSNEPEFVSRPPPLKYDLSWAL